jgi:hypothetical protein
MLARVASGARDRGYRGPGCDGHSTIAEDCTRAVEDSKALRRPTTMKENPLTKLPLKSEAADILASQANLITVKRFSDF